MNEETRFNLLVGDVPIDLVSDIPFTDFKPDKYFPSTDEKGRTQMVFMRYEKPNLGFIEIPHTLVLEMDTFGIEVAKFQSYYLRLLLPYLASLNSKNYSFVHGCGMVMGVRDTFRCPLFIGPQGSGKSAIQEMFDPLQKDADGEYTASHFPNSTLDDDIILLDTTSMYAPGRYSGRTAKIDGKKEIIWLENRITHLPLEAIFLLDKNLPGGKVKGQKTRIPRAVLASDTLPQWVVRPYWDLAPYEAPCPVYRLGTDGNLKGTKKAIEEILFSL